MRIVGLKETPIAHAVEVAVNTLKKGGIIVYPTETFYALGVRFDDDAALKRLFELKGRPAEKAMPLIIGGPEDLSSVASRISDSARILMQRFWPGPLTILLPAVTGLSEYVSSKGKLAVRVPGESFALRLARGAGFPVTATSANPSGMPPPDNAEAVAGYFPDGIDLLIDGGKTPGGPPSTIVDAGEDGIKIIREGAIDKAQLYESDLQ